VVAIVQKRRLGRTGLQVSVIGFGGIPIIALSRKEAEKVVKYAYEKGINYFDTARAYGDSEDKMGAALKDVRDDVIIATKTHQRTKEEAARAGLKQSLRNLQTDRIDIVQLHGIGHNPYVLEKAIETGKFDTVLVPLNVLDRRFSEKLLPLAEELDVGVVVMKPLGGCGAPLQYPQGGARFLGKPESVGIRCSFWERWL